MNYAYIFSIAIICYGLIHNYIGTKRRLREKKDERNVNLVFFSYFTVLSNMLVLGYWTLQVIGYDVPIVEGATRLYITVTGIVYALVLRPRWKIAQEDRMANFSVHVYSPLASWIFFVFENPISWGQENVFLFWLLFPILYLIWVIFLGRQTGKYPYFFLNRGMIGTGKWVISLASLLFLFFMLGGFILFLGKIS